jgi:hypothetical protein
LRKGVAYIPTTARTEAGYWLAIEPVEAIERGNPVVKTPTRQNFPPPVMQPYCGMKSFSEFERTAALGPSAREMTPGLSTRGAEANDTGAHVQCSQIELGECGQRKMTNRGRATEPDDVSLSWIQYTADR